MKVKTGTPGITIYLTLIISIFIGCKKEKVNQIPVVEIINPAANTIFGSPDSIFVNATITDDNLIEVIKVAVTDQNFQTVQTPIYIFPNNSNYQLQLTYPIDNKIDESGAYYLQVRAEDGTDFKNAYQPIQILSSPREFEQALVITNQGSNLLHLYAFKQSEDPDLIFTFDGDYSASEINSVGKQLYITGSNQLNLLAFNLNNNLIDWKLDPVPLQPMHNKDCLYFNEFLLCTFYTDYIYGYSNKGAIIFNSSVEETESPTVIWRAGNYILADFQRTTNGQTFIKTMFTSTGLEKQRLLTNYEVVGFHSLNNSEAFITANLGSIGKIIHYNIDQNVSTTQADLSGLITCTESVKNGEVLIGTSEGLYLYITNQNSLVPVDGSIIASKLSYDDIGNALYIVVDNEVRIFSWPQMVVQRTIQFSETILDLHLQFTK